MKESVVVAQVQRAEMMEARSSACGKAIIVGEHAVVYGARAIAMPVHTKRSQLKLIDYTSSDQLDESAADRKNWIKDLDALIDDAFTLFGVSSFPIKIEGKTDIPIGAGLGSSASLCVGVLRGISELIGRSLSANELASMANILEKRFHGNPSGLDTAVVAFERVIEFKKGCAPSLISVKPLISDNQKIHSWPFVLIDSEVRSCTIDMIKKASPYFAHCREEKIAAFNQLADQARAGLETGDQQQVAFAMESAGKKLKEAGVVTSYMEQIACRAREAGVLAIKPTGAGGGGCLLALLPHEHSYLVLARLRQLFNSRQLSELCIG